MKCIYAVEVGSIRYPVDDDGIKDYGKPMPGLTIGCATIEEARRICDDGNIEYCNIRSVWMLEEGENTIHTW